MAKFSSFQHSVCVPAVLPVCRSLKWRAGRKRVVVNSYRLVNEVSDDKRFPKKISVAMEEVRNGAGDGLFTVCYVFAFYLSAYNLA